MISRRTSGSVPAGAGLVADHGGEQYTAVCVDVDLLNGEQCFRVPRRTGDPDAPRPRAGRRPVRRPGGACGPATSSWTFAELDGLANAFARHLAGRGVGRGDRVAVMTSNRVEFVAAVHAGQQGRRGGRAAEPGLEGGRGRPRPRAHGAPPRGRRRRRGRAARRPARAATRSPTSTTRRRSARRPRGPDRAAPAPTPARTTPTTSSSCSARAPPGCPRRCATPTGRSATPPPTGCAALGLGPDDRFQVATPPSHILGLLNLLAAAEAGATVRLHRRFDLDEVLRRIAVRPHHARDGGGPHRPGAGQPPRPRGLRPLVAALHHVGRHPGDRERGRGRSPGAPASAGWRPTAPASCRSSPATRSASPPPGASTPPACRPRASSCGWSTSTPARCSPRARSARSRPAAPR